MYFELKNIGAIKQAQVELGKLTVICGKNNTGKTYVTYSLYGLLHHFFSQFVEVAKFQSLDTEKLETELKEQGMIRIDLRSVENELNHVAVQLSQFYTEQLKDIFSANAKAFVDAEFNIYLAKMPIDYSDRFEFHAGNRIAVKDKNSSTLEIKLKKLAPRNFSEFLFIEEALFQFWFRTHFPTPFILSAERTGIQLFQKELDKNKSELVKALTKTRQLELLEENVARFALPLEENIDFVRELTTYQFL